MNREDFYPGIQVDLSDGVEVRRPDYEIVTELAGRIWATIPGDSFDEAGFTGVAEFSVRHARAILAEAKRQCGEGEA